MLVIRDEQMEALRAAFAAGFPDRALRRISRTHPDALKAQGEPAIRALIGRAVRTAISGGIERDADVLAFVELLLDLGPSFETGLGEPWAREILGDPSISGQAKIQLLRLRYEQAAEES